MHAIRYCKTLLIGEAEYSLNFDAQSNGNVMVSVLDDYTKSSSSSSGTTKVTYEKGDLTPTQKEQIIYDFVHQRFSMKATTETDAVIASKQTLEKQVSRLYRNQKLLMGVLVLVSAVFANCYFRAIR